MNIIFYNKVRSPDMDDYLKSKNNNFEILYISYSCVRLNISKFGSIAKNVRWSTVKNLKFIIWYSEY